ncbi:hypothetical protein [Streptomyces subrutilus]|nr:hypothetical protein [Streptomyces subrutilus]
MSTGKRVAICAVGVVGAIVLLKVAVGVTAAVAGPGVVPEHDATQQVTGLSCSFDDPEYIGGVPSHFYLCTVDVNNTEKTTRAFWISLQCQNFGYVQEAPTRDRYEVEPGEQVVSLLGQWQPWQVSARQCKVVSATSAPVEP